MSDIRCGTQWLLCLAFPTNLIAAMFNFQHKDYFTVAGANEREAPKVSFS